MNKPSALFFRAVSCIGCFLLAVSAALADPVAGPNVNMVSGTKWPEGDPFLTKQNEPSIAVSSRNSRHLLAGSNDYRLVPVELAESISEPEAWLTIYKSVDGGASWRATPVGGCPINIPECNDATGLTASLKQLAPNFGADPTVRPGPYGTFFLSFIAGTRGTGSNGIVGVQRFVDKNNDVQRATDVRNCTQGMPGCVPVYAPNTCTGPGPGCTLTGYVEVKSAEDPILPDKYNTIAIGTPGQTTDKPWVMADVPGRPWNASKTCQLLSWTKSNAKVSDASETVNAFNVYVSYAKFLGQGSNPHAQIYVAVSNDCGNTFVNDIKVSASTLANQGSSLAVDPLTGAVYVVWRNFDGPQAIYMAKSTDGGQSWNGPFLVANYHPYDQGATSVSIRTLGFPTVAVSVDKNGVSRVHVAWAQRKAVPATIAPYACPSANAADCDARIVMTTSVDGGKTWPAAVPVDGNPVDPNNPANPNGRGHQVQPALTFSAGKLLITWLDQRQDHTVGVLQCLPVGQVCANVSQLTEVRRAAKNSNLDPNCHIDVSQPPLSTLPPATKSLLQNCNHPEAVWTTYITDGTLGLVRRHTLDNFAAMADPADVPQFSSSRVSQYTFGSTVAGQVNADGTLTVQPGTYDIVQKEVNAPNLPMFTNGTSAFIGDYIDAAGQSIVATGDPNQPYKWNVGGGASGAFVTGGFSPAFHVAFTDNRDVIPPLNGDWTTPTCITTAFTKDANGNITGVNPAAGCGSPGYAGNRNQNVYTAAVVENSVAFANANSKVLNATTPRGFVVTVRNLSNTGRNYTLTLPAQAAGVTASFDKSTFPSGSPKTSLMIFVQPRSSSARTVWATSTTPNAKVLVQIASTDGSYSTQLFLNPDAHAQLITNGDGGSVPDTVGDNLGNVVLSNAVLTNNVLSNNALSNNVLTNNALTNAALSNVVLSNAVLSNLDPVNAALSNNVLTNNVLSNVVLSNAALSNNALSNAVLSNVVLSNNSLNAALTNLDPANVALSNAVLSNNALSNVALTNNVLSNVVLTNNVLSNAVLSNVVLSNAALSNNALSNNALSNVALSNAPLADAPNNPDPEAPLRGIEVFSPEIANNPFQSNELSNSTFKETTFPIRNHGNIDTTLSVKLMLRDAICTGAPAFQCTPPPGYVLQLVLRKVALVPVAIPPTGPAISTGRAIRIGIAQVNSEVSNVSNLPLIDPTDPNFGQFLPDDPNAATLSLAAGEYAYATIRAIGVGGATPPDPADLLQWGVKTVTANANNANGPLVIRTLNFPNTPQFVALTPASPTLLTFGGVPTITATAACADKFGNTVLNGIGPPASNLGAVGNFYIDTQAQMIYGPLTASGWGTGTALIVNGPSGPQASMPCPPAAISVGAFTTNHTTFNSTATISFTPRYWGDFYTLVNVADASSPAQTDRQVIKVSVQPRPPVLTLAAPATLTYSQGINLRPLVASDSKNGAGVAQPIVISASSPNGSCHMADADNLVVDHATTPVGGPADCIVTAKQDGNEIYAPATVTEAIYINQADQTIIVDSIPTTLTYNNNGLPAATLAAHAHSATAQDSGLPVTFSSATPLVCTVTPNGQVTIVAAGTCTVTAVQSSGSRDYKASMPLTAPNITINQAAQNIAFGPAPPPVTFGDLPVTVSATSASPTAPPSGIPVTFSSLTPAICTAGGVNGATVTIVAAGMCTIAANQLGNSNYNAATQVTQSFMIARGKLNVSATVSPTPIVFGDDAPPNPVSVTYGTSSSGPQACLLTPFTATLSGQPTPPANAGSYTIVPLVTSTISPSCDVIYTNGTLTVNKAQPQFSGNSGIVFTPLGSPTTVSGNLNRPDKPTVYPKGDTLTVVVNNASTAFPPYHPVLMDPDGSDSITDTFPSDTYTVVATYAGSSNFLPAGPVNVTLRVEGFSAAGTMTQARARHRSVLLNDGRVLIAGGFDTSTGTYVRVATSEVYCPDTMSPPPTATQCPQGVGQFSAVGSLHSGSDGLTLTQLLDGRVLKVGGGNGDVETFDPVANTWTLLPGAALPVASSFHQATLLTCAGSCAYNGKVLITGGDDYTGSLLGTLQNTLSSTLIFDPATNTLSAGPTMSTARDSHADNLLPNGKVLITGGEQLFGSGYVALSSTDIYDPTDNTIVAGPAMSSARFSHGDALLADGRVLVAGGSNDPSGQRTGLLATAEIYDPATNLWTAIVPAEQLTDARRSFTTTLLFDNFVLVAGGFGMNVPRLSSSQLFDPSVTGFDGGAVMGTARARHRATRLPDGRVLVTGGTIDLTPPIDAVHSDWTINSAEFYNGPPHP